MLSIYEIILPLVLIAVITLPLIPVLRGKVDAKNAKFRVWMQVSTFAVALFAVLIIGGTTFAANDDPGFAGSFGQGMGFLAAALSVAASVIGAGYAVGQAAPAAIGAISENSENFGKAMIFVALAEGVAIYGLLIAIQIINKL